MASISGSVTIAGDPDDWIAVAWDADTHAYAGVAAVSGGAYEITGLTAGKAYVVGCRPKTGAVWTANTGVSENGLILPTDPVTTPYIFKATDATPGDPYFSSVSALLHMDGADDGTTFTEVTGKTVNRTGAVTKTGQKKFGTASAYFDGTDDYLYLADNNALDFGTGDFTIECWIRANTSSQTQLSPRILAKGLYNEMGSWAVVLIAGTGVLLFDIYGSSISNYTIGTLTNDTWLHVAACRASGQVKTFLHGVEGGGGTNNTDLSNTFAFAIGAEPNLASDYLGYIDDVRLTKGVARYSSTFTPPDAAFPDTGSALTGSNEPTWPNTPGNTVVDGDITWTNMGQLLDPLIAGPLIAV